MNVSSNFSIEKKISNQFYIYYRYSSVIVFYFENEISNKKVTKKINGEFRATVQKGFSPNPLFDGFWSEYKFYSLSDVQTDNALIGMTQTVPTPTKRFRTVPSRPEKSVVFRNLDLFVFLRVVEKWVRTARPRAFSIQTETLLYTNWIQNMSFDCDQIYLKNQFYQNFRCNGL